MRITGAVTAAKGQSFKLTELELEEPRRNEVLVRMVGVGVCHTDLVARDQLDPVPLPAVLGHEGSGIVERVGADVTVVAPGDHVVLSFSSCGKCRMCEQGRPAHCTTFYELNFGGSRADGTSPFRCDCGTVHGSFFGQSSFATYSVVPERNIVKVDKNVPLELLGPLGCGIQTGAGAVLKSLRPEPGSSIAVFGTGAVGLSAVMAAVVAGCTTIIAIDLNEGRLELAKELGATDTINGRAGNTLDSILELTNGVGIDYTLDTTAVPSVFRCAVDALATGGTCGLIGGAAPGTEVSIDMVTLLFGKTIKGIVEGDSVPRSFIPALIQLHRQGRFPFDRLIRKYPFADINRAVADSERGDTVKPVLTFT